MFQSPIPLTSREVRLFCIPHAGGGATAYRGWRDRLRPEVEATIVELPGRESRFREPSYTRMDLLVSDLVDAVIPNIAGGERFAFFGNSLGSLIAFETLHEIRRRTGREAEHFFVSASGAPHMTPPLPPMGHLPDAELLRLLCDRYGGIPAQLIEDESFLAAIMPTMRADIQLLEAYPRGHLNPLGCPITAFGGLRDSTLPLAHLDAWRDQTTGAFLRIALDEEHLYLQTARDLLIARIKETLAGETVPETRPALDPVLSGRMA